MSSANNAIILVARILLSAIFILSGFGKLTDPAGTASMISQAGLPMASVLAYLAGIFELVSGLCVLTGFQTRLVGWALALFCLVTGAIFHAHPISVPGFPDAANGYLSTMNQIMFMKNITMAGAYILLATYGAGAYSLDARRSHRPALA
ncbi:DoxX family protein [Allorhizobium sp. BGMRC 0089]|uniref:DoxX family protein n=1 Tax=Allorhizobium sonneratiae TaxID=2934936 RepID=UPI002033D579|nr:DoxX family protein [Allorhizobium sonneratiae]MCM2293841.1 DoxX family protein [Allorhizobium sonneratiae]